MMKRWKKTLTLLLALVMLLSLCVSGFAAGIFEIDSKTAPSAAEQKPKDTLEDGELYAYTRVTGDPLPSSEFTVELAAIGQQYKTTTTTTQRHNIVFLMDVSNSMEGSRMTNMVSAANSVAEALLKGDNKLAVVTFAQTARTERQLSDTGVYFTEESGVRVTNKDVIRVTLRKSYDNDNGGTNIQAAFIEAYNILKDANDSDAVPVIILLSDGAPTYYFNNIASLSKEQTQQGTGSASATVNVVHTIAQAAYIKALMPKLKIYSIPFSLSTTDRDYSYATATLNPTDANISKLSTTTFRNTWNSLVDSVPSEHRSRMSKDYITASYSAKNSASSLSDALRNIIEHMNFQKPFAETTGEDGELTDSSYLWARYQIGKGYILAGDTVTVQLGDLAYAFTRIGEDFVLQTDDAPDAGVEKVQIRLTDSGLLEWKVPASALPCRVPGGVDEENPVDPIVLRFKLAFDLTADGLREDTDYPTSTSCQYFFWPSADNPYYYGETQVESRSYTYTTETYYAAQFHQPSSGNPALRGFAMAASEADLENGYIDGAGSLKVDKFTTQYNSKTRQNEPALLRVKYGGKDIDFTTFSQRTASAEMAYDPARPEASQYAVQSFSDGRRAFSDARVTKAENKSGNQRTVTVSYDNGKRSVVFENVKFEELQREIEVKAEITKTTRYLIFTEYTINWVQIGDTLDNNPSVSNLDVSLESLFGSTYTVTFKYKGETYKFTGVNLSGTSVTRVMTAVVKEGLNVFQAAPEQGYYYAQAAVTEPLAPEFRIENGDFAILVNGGPVEIHKKDSIVSIEPVDGGYVVKKDIDGDLYTYTYTAGPSGKTYSKNVTRQNTRGMVDGKVTITSNPVGIIRLKVGMTAEEIAGAVGAKVTLRSTFGNGTTPASRLGERTVADIYLYFTVSDTIAAPEFTLDSTDVPIKSFAVTDFARKSGGAYVSQGSSIPSALGPGEYRIRYRIEFDTPTTEYTWVRFTRLAFKWNGYGGLLNHNPDYANQKVRVSFDTSKGH